MWGWASKLGLGGTVSSGWWEFGRSLEAGLRRSIRKNGNVIETSQKHTWRFPSVFCEDILILSTKPMEIVMYVFKIRFGEKFEVEIASL